MEKLYVTQVSDVSCIKLHNTIFRKRDYVVTIPQNLKIITDFAILENLRKVQSSEAAKTVLESHYSCFLDPKSSSFQLAHPNFPLLFSSGGILYRISDLDSGSTGYLFISRTDTPRLSLFAGRSSSLEEIFDPLKVAYREGFEEGIFIQENKLLLPPDFNKEMIDYAVTLTMQEGLYFSDIKTLPSSEHFTNFFNQDRLQINTFVPSACIVSWDPSNSALDAIRIIPIELSLSRLEIYDTECDGEKFLQRDHVFVPASVFEKGEGDCLVINSRKGIKEKRSIKDYKFGYTARTVLSRFHPNSTYVSV
ncbi:MAG: hypothetical protein Q8R18_01690 [bacterium]|nr:hypothetical protein [bacterium]